MRRIIVPFLTFIALFIGTGFVSGSIVHMGEGVNAWDLSLLAIGIVLFVGGSVFQDIQQGMKRIRGEGILWFLFLSLLLSIGIGMASGGMQHFVDTPSYSAILIPVGLLLGFIAFVLKERLLLGKREMVAVLLSVLATMTLLAIVLRSIATALPEELTHGHGHRETPSTEEGADTVPDDASSSSRAAKEEHPHDEAEGAHD